MAIMYKGRCPCPHRLEYGDHADKKQCTKGGGILVKDWNREIVATAFVTHLVESPYHKFERDEAEDVVQHVLIEEEHWSQDDHDDYMNKYGGGQRQGDDSRKRLAPRSPPRPSREERARHTRARVEPEKKDSGTLALASNPRASGDMVQIRKGELQVVIDSIKRATCSARSAEKLCDGAATSFRAEANALEAAHNHFSQLAMYM